MRSILAGLRQLVIPWGASQNQPRVVIGASVPPEILAYYQGIDPDAQIITGQIAYLDDDRYRWAVLALLPNFGTPGPSAVYAEGITNLNEGVIAETRTEYIDFPISPFNGAGTHDLIGTNINMYDVVSQETFVDIFGRLRVSDGTPNTAALPGVRVATTTFTADSVSFTATEGSVGSLVAGVTGGHRYRVIAEANWGGDAGEIRIRIREGTTGTGGTIRQECRHTIAATTSLGYRKTISYEYLAPTDGVETWSLTGDVLSGGPNNHLEASSQRPGYFWIEWCDNS